MFDIQGTKIKLSTDDLAIPPFKDYYNNAKDKSRALKDIEYVIWLYKWNSPYDAYPEKQRASVLGKDLYGDENFKPDAELKQLGKRFQSFRKRLELDYQLHLRKLQKVLQNLQNLILKMLWILTLHLR